MHNTEAPGPDRGDLVLDMGMHYGEDSAFYLAKGFRVVAVEASSALCHRAEKRFQNEIGSGRLVLVHGAIWDGDDTHVEFYNNENSQWGTVRPDWLRRNIRLSSGPTSVERVPVVTLDQLVVRHGCPYYLKIDLEGADVACLRQLERIGERPTYVSLESNKVSWRELVGELDLLTDLGYTRFKVVPQHTVSRRPPPVPGREGRTIHWTFPWSGSSGVFGAELGGRWLSRRGALYKYRWIFLKYWLFGDNAITAAGLRGLIARTLQQRFGEPGWYDTHAAL